MPALTDRFTVVVRRRNEGPHDDPFVTIEAHTVALEPDGMLSIIGEKISRVFSGGTWSGFEVHKK